jgi:hypothetical protein
MSRLFDFFQNTEIYGTHDFSDSQRPLVLCRQGIERRLCLCVVLMSPCSFEVEKLAEFRALLPLEDYLIGAAEFFEIVLRQIDAALGCVSSDVP